MSAGVYTAGVTANVTDTITVTDSLGNSAQASVTVTSDGNSPAKAPTESPPGARDVRGGRDEGVRVEDQLLALRVHERREGGDVRDGVGLAPHVVRLVIEEDALAVGRKRRRREDALVDEERLVDPLVREAAAGRAEPANDRARLCLALDHGGLAAVEQLDPGAAARGLLGE